MDSIYKENDNVIPFVDALGDITNEERVHIYRNCVFVSLKNLLSDVFPSIVEMVGIEFFRYLTHEFIKTQPPTNGALMLYGGEFKVFLASFSALKEYPYLSDVAAIEWAMHQSYDAADDKACDAQDFQDWVKTDIENLKRTFVNSVHLFEFSSPAYSLWQASKEEGAAIENIDLAQHEYVLVYRDKQLDVQVCNLAKNAYMFYNALKNNKTFVEASTCTEGDIQNDIAFALSEDLFKKKDIK